MKCSTLSEAFETCGGAPRQSSDREKRGVIGYKRQMEIYQWLFRKNGFKILDTGHFVYCNGNTDKEAFDGKLEFDIKVIAYEGDTSCVEAQFLKLLNVSNQTSSPVQALIVISANIGEP